MFFFVAATIKLQALVISKPG